MSEDNLYNIDDILASFEESTASPEEKPAAAQAPASPKVPRAKAPASANPERVSSAAATPRAEQAVPSAPRQVRTRPAGNATQAQAREKAAATVRRVRKEQQEEEARALQKKPVKKGLRKIHPALNAVFVLAFILCLAWGLFNVHPGASGVVKVTATPQPTVTPTAAPTMEPVAETESTEEAVAEPTPEPTPEKIHYTIDETAVVAPKPDPDCYGSVAVTDASELLDVIQQARDYGLLGEDETVVFDPNVEFNQGSYYQDIKYYLDETILVICWKQLVDGYTTSCVEVKIADGSQFRRKFVDDTYGSSATDYLTNLAASTNAVVAMNADYYNFRNLGIVVYNRELYKYSDYTYTGNFKMYNCLDNMFVTAGGDFLFTHYGTEFTEDELKQYIADNDIVFGLSFGPILVENGELNQSYWEDGWYPIGEITTQYSRAGIGQVDTLHYLYMSLNHSDEQAARWTMQQFAQRFYEMGVKNAYALDGGQTSEIVMNGEVYNHVDFGTERTVSDMIYFATAISN